MAKGLNFNFNFNYDVNLDKLYNDAKTSDKAQITSTQNDVADRYDGGTANTYGGYSNNQTETLDLSSSVSNETNPATNNGSSNTDFSNNISTNNNTQSINMNNNSTSSTSLESSNTSSFNSSLNNNSQNTNGVNLSSNNQSVNSGTNNITSNNSINSSTNNLNSNTSSNINSSTQSTINQFNSNQNIETSNKSTTGQASYNNSANIDTNSSTSKINTSSTETPSNNASTNVNINSSTSSSTNESLNNKEVSVDANSNSMNKSSNSMSINNGEVIFTTIDNKGQEIVTKIAVEDYINTLQSYGLRIEDINRILNGKITLEALLEEIQNDSDTSRKEEMMASSYLQAYGLDFTNMKDLESAINEKTKELAKLQQEKREMDNHEIDSIMNIVTRLKMGEDLDNILKTPVAWQYTDENGNVSYRYDNPYETGYDPTMNQNAYTPLTFEEMYKDSKLLEELKSVLSQETIKPFFFGEEKTIYRWNETSEQSAYFDKIVTNYNNTTTERKDNLKELNSKIEELQSQLLNYQYIYDYINNEISYYMRNVDSYTSKDDFILKSDFNPKCLDRINEIKTKYEGIQNFNYTAEMPVIYINDKSQLVDVLSCMINEEGNVANGYLNIGTTIVQLSSTDEMLGHYEKWISFMSADEKSVFNYIYNTEGTNAAYDYLKGISDELDNRWLANKTQEDQEFASEHPVLASVASIVVTPIEGISAACYSMNSLLRNEKIRRTDVYSAGDVWRGQVAQDIAEYSPTLSFVYSTGMSMADSVSLIAISAATGGTATPVISAALMGSRAYVSTLNDALDRGLSDGTAVALAWSSAVVETAMESYSVGHLLNLETKLGESTSKLVTKIADSIPKKELANIVTQTTYVAASAISQGIAEGEEEFATEILNYMFDTFLCNINDEGNKSNYAISINNYINMGYTEEEAFQLTMSDFGNQAFQAFLGGFASGICFGSFAGVKTSYKVSKQMSQNIINDYEGRGASLKNIIANFKAGIDAMNSIDAKTFAQGIEINRVQQEMMEQAYKEQQAQQYKEIIENITKPLTSLANQSTAITLLDIKKATLGTILSIPAFFNKFRSATLASNQQLITKISNEGLLHLTTEEAANKIIESGYIKASKDPIVSYGKPKSFFFAGIPNFGNVCLNLNTFREKAVAVRIKPSTEILNNKEFNYRAYDDFAIMHSGNLNFEQGTAEIVYLGLTVNDAGEFEYKEITKDEYDNYTPNTESISRNAPKTIKKLADSIKGALYGLAYQYDVFGNKIITPKETKQQEISSMIEELIVIKNNFFDIDLNSEGVILDKLGNPIGKSFDNNIVKEVLDKYNDSFDLTERATSCKEIKLYSGKSYVILRNHAAIDIESFSKKASVINKLSKKNINTPNLIAKFSDGCYTYEIQELAPGKSILGTVGNDYQNILFSLDQLHQLSNLNEVEYLKFIKDLCSILENGLDIDPSRGNLMYDNSNQKISFIDLSPDECQMTKEEKIIQIYNSLTRSTVSMFNRYMEFNLDSYLPSTNNIVEYYKEIKEKIIIAYEQYLIEIGCTEEKINSIKEKMQREMNLEFKKIKTEQDKLNDLNRMKRQQAQFQVRDILEYFQEIAEEICEDSGNRIFNIDMLPEEAIEEIIDACNINGILLKKEDIIIKNYEDTFEINLTDEYLKKVDDAICSENIEKLKQEKKIRAKELGVELTTEEENIKIHNFSPELVNFFKKNNIGDNIIYDELCYKICDEGVHPICSRTKWDKITVSVDKIIGCSGESLIGSLKSRFRKDGTPYQSRSLGLLDATSDEIISTIQSSNDEIKVLPTSDGNYVVSENGRHRISVLRILYLNEVKQAKKEEIQQIKEKYQIPVFVLVEDKIVEQIDEILPKTKYKSAKRVDQNNIILTGEIQTKYDDFGNPYYFEPSFKITDEEAIQLINNPQIVNFIGYINDYKEQIKNFTGQTDEELSYLDDFRAKVISYGSIEQIIENLDSFDNWEMQRLLNIENPIVVELFNSQKVINYVTENMSKKEIINYSAVIPSHPIIESTFLSLTNKEVEEIGISTILNEFKNFSLDTQKKFVDYHEEFFVKKLNSIFSENLSKDAFMIIFNKVGSFEFLQSNQWNISNLSSEIQNELYNKYKEILYTGTQKQFTQFVTKINDPDYQTQFIKNSPFYSEMINSTDFENIFTNIKDKNFALEIYSNPDAKNKILASGACFKKLLSFLTVEEQLDYLSVAKDKIIEVANSKIYNAVNIISLYITAFNDNNQIALLNDQQIIKSMDSETIIRLTKMFSGFYNEEILKWSSDTMDTDKAKMLFIPEIYEKMDQDAINKAAVALPVYDYDRLIQLNNNEAINAVLDSLISQNFRKFKSNSGFQHLDNFINLYNVLDEEGKQKIKDNISSSMLVSVLAYKEEESLSECLIQKLVNDTEYFDTLTLEGLRQISSFSTDLYGKIYKYLRPQFKLVTFNLENIISLNIQEELIEVFRNKPNLVNYLNVENCSIADFLSLLSANDDIELLYDNLNVETIISLLGESSKNESYLAKLHTLDFERLKKCIVNNIANLELKIKRTPVGILISDYVQISRILKMFNYQEQVEILDAMKKSDKYLMLFLDLNLDQDVQFKILNDMMSDPELRNSILDDNMELFTNFFDKLNVNTIEYVMNNMNNNFLGFVMSITKRNDLNVKFNEIIKNNPLILSEFNYVDAEMVYSNLSKENADIIDKYVAKYLKEIQNNNLDTLLSDASIAQKSFFIKAFNQNLISNEKLQLLMNIKSKNKFVLSTFNYSLFDDTIYKFGDELLTKLSKYYDVVDQIVELKKNPQKFNLFAQFVINDTTSSSPIVADQKMAMLLNYLLENDVSPELLTVSNQEELEIARNIILKEIDQFSILDSFEKELVRDRSIITPDNFKLQDYDLKLAEKCDDMLKNATSVSEVQNLIFNKYFSISIEDATELFRMYGSRFASIKNLDTDGIATTYLENMTNILNMSMEEAIDYYNSFDTINRYSMNDTLNILNSIKQIYTKSLKSTLFNPTDITGYVDYDGKKIPIYEPKGDFQMLVQSTYTNYGGMPMINDNYFDSWNLSSRTANHGICCSLISNNNMGMAMVRGPGVVIGFNNFSDEQMNMMAPYDIYTRNDGYVIKCQRPLLYLPGQDVMNETRHTHNEFNLERTNLTGEGELANIQPDYVVVFEEMSEEQKQNAYKASVEFAVPLVYINKTSLAASESAKIDSLISEYKSSGNIELLKEILVLHENNRSGYRNPTDSSLVTQYFSSDRIISVLNEAIESITIEKDLQYIKEFLEDEIRKFDTTLEATHRANEIDIDVKDLITKIDNKISALADIEATKDMIIQLHDEDPEITAKIISIGKLLEIIKNNELFEELQTYEEYKAPDRKLVSNFTRVEYLEAYMQLYNAIKKNNYNLGLTDEQNLRLESLYNEAINTLEISKIQYSEFLPDEIKLKVMFNNNTIYNYSDLNTLYNYYFEHFTPEILNSNPTLIYSPEFKFYLNILGDYVFSNTSQLSNSDLNFWNSLVTLKKDCENIIIEDKIDVGEQEFQNLISNIYNWHQNEREYVDYFTNYYDVDVSNLNYDSELPNSLKIKIMIRDNKVYDRDLAINEFNKIITKESITDYNLIFNDLFMFYFNNISPTLTPEEANKTYDYNTLKKIYLNILNKIVKQNIDISEENFKKLLNMIYPNQTVVLNYISNYLENHEEIDSTYVLAPIIDKIQYSDNLPKNLKNEILYKIQSEYDWFILQNSSNVYGSDQNAVFKYITIDGNYFDWLTDENDFINYLTTKREYDQDTAKKILQSLKETNGWFKINQATDANIVIEYIFDKCARENRFDVLDIFEKSFTFQYNSEIERLGNKLMDQGMSYVEALRTLCAIDSTGCCSYAAVVNSILLSYKNNPQAFENDFGYPMYVYIDGKQEFNAAELLLDMYIYLNSNKYVGNQFKVNMFTYDQTGALHIKELTTNGQVYLSGYTWHNENAINSFLASKKSSLRYNLEGGKIYGQGYIPSTKDSVAKMKEQVINYLKQNVNNSVELGLHRTEKIDILGKKKIIPLRFMTETGEVYRTTETWDEGDGHAVFVTGVLDNYFVVSSWGKRLLIPIEDFIDNNFNVIFRKMEGIK